MFNYHDLTDLADILGKGTFSYLVFYSFGFFCFEFRVLVPKKHFAVGNAFITTSGFLLTTVLPSEWELIVCGGFFTSSREILGSLVPLTRGTFLRGVFLILKKD